MNIEQMKSDLDQGIMLARTEIVKLVEAALLMRHSLINIQYQEGEYPDEIAEEVLTKVNEL